MMSLKVISTLICSLSVIFALGAVFKGERGKRCAPVIVALLFSITLFYVVIK